MELRIDGRVCDLAPGERVVVACDVERMLTPRGAGEARSIGLRLPRSAANDALFGCGLPGFNTEPHRGELLCDGALVLGGRLRLAGSGSDGYDVTLDDGAAGWAVAAARRRLDETPLGFETRLTPSEIAAGWRSDGPVKFLPLLRDRYEGGNDATDLQPGLRLLAPEEYHPFVRVGDLVRAIFDAAGYEVRSRFMEGELFRSLHMSGAYAAHDTAAAEERLGFCAVRLAEATAEADALGRVYATPYGEGNTVGNIVETADPLAVDGAGRPATGAYDRGGCFGTEGSKIVYRPGSTLAVGFEYRLRYTTDHRIADRERLTGFDSFNLGTGGNLPFTLPNRYVDRRGELRGGGTYRAVVFGGGADDSFRLLCTLDGVGASHWCDFAGRSAAVTTPAGASVESPVLYVLRGGAWQPWEGDWALYDGHIGERGSTTVEVTLRTPAESVGPSAPKYFDTIFFYGAEEGMRLTLHRGTSVRPLFAATPACGERLTAADICRHGIGQLELLEAVAHLFDLRFATDRERRQVVVEPALSFWEEERTADWSDRTDFAQPVVWVDAALGENESRTYGYRRGDGAADRAAGEGELPFGSWRVWSGSAACDAGDEERTNPLFCPTVSRSGGYAGAPSALLMQAGDRDDPSDDGSRVIPRIVRWCGMKSLPEGERWPDPTGGGAYPLAAFHLAGGAAQEGFTLCFEDRDGLGGLHRYYDRTEAVIAARSHVTLTLRMEPHEYAALFTPGTASPDLRSVFRIGTDRGRVCATLRRIDAYDPEAASARCTFTLLWHDRA